MRFALYLLRRDVITTDQFAQLVEAHLDEQAPLGQLAIEQGVLGVREVLKVLRLQSDLPHDRFGETAVELELLTRDQVAELLMKQASRRRPMSQLVVDFGFLTEDQARQEMQAFRRRQERGGAAARRTLVENAIQHVAEREAAAV